MNPATITKPSALDIPCPECKAAPTFRCRTPQGKARLPHAARKGNNRPGRKPLLNPDLVDYICTALANGVPVDAATQSAGISDTTFYRWMAQADDDNNPYVEEYRAFREAAIRARARGQVELVELIQSAARPHLKSEKASLDGEGHPIFKANGEPVMERVFEQDWRAAFAILERSYARNWSRRETLEISNRDGLDPTPAMGQLGAGMDEASYGRILTGIAIRRERLALERGEVPDNQVTEGEIVS